MTATPTPAPTATFSIVAPLRHPVFRRIWVASLLSNFGILIMGVGAAWSMTQMTSSPDMVALVQTASMLPTALLSLPAGAIADMFDRRLVGHAALTLAFIGAVSLTLLTWAGLLAPAPLLALCFVIGSGMALFGPAWQASVSEQVPAEALTAAVALNGISYNIARSIGPAIGGFIVALAGSIAAFGANAALYIPLLLVLYLWQREAQPSRLPPERLPRAMISGIRYILNSPSIRVVLGRTFATGLAGGSVSALMPLVARDLLGGGPTTYGLILGAFGLGAVIGALNVGQLRSRLNPEQAVRLCALVMGTGTVVIAISRSPLLTGFVLLFVGAGWTASVTMFNVAVQMSAPRWVSGRALAAYQAAIAGGIAIGSWGWGRVSATHGVEDALLASGIVMAASILLSRWMRMPPATARGGAMMDALDDPEVRLPLTERSGPIVVEIEYRVDPAQARLFYAVMQHVQQARQRTGVYGWSIARDLADPELWTERYHCPTWYDYLRQRNRATKVESELHARAMGFHIGPKPVRIRRMLERPVGSVRWKDTTPDQKTDDIDPMSGLGGGH